VFEQNKWEFQGDDFNDMYNNLLSIRNLEQRLAVIKAVRIWLQEDIKLKLENNNSDVNIFMNFSDLIDGLFQQTKEEIDRQKHHEKPFYYNEEEQIALLNSFNNFSSTTCYYNEEEQIALLNSFNNFSSTTWYE
jgi:hypothetical protein